MPGEKEWSVIFNTETGQWATKTTADANFDASKNALSVKVKPMKTGATERLVHDVTAKGFLLRWENVSVPVNIK